MGEPAVAPNGLAGRARLRPEAGKVRYATMLRWRDRITGDLWSAAVVALLREMHPDSRRWWRAVTSLDAALDYAARRRRVFPVTWDGKKHPLPRRLSLLRRLAASCGNCSGVPGVWQASPSGCSRSNRRAERERAPRSAVPPGPLS
jgi:hypothetical protein